MEAQKLNKLISNSTNTRCDENYRNDKETISAHCSSAAMAMNKGIVEMAFRRMQKAFAPLGKKETLFELVNDRGEECQSEKT
jgi:hypothetical protein